MTRRIPILGKHQFGFTLVELAVVLLIVGLILGGLIVPLVTQVTSRKVEESRKSMEEIVTALYGFASANGRLPCPATVASNGIENRRNDNAAVGPIDAVTDGCRGGTYVGLVPWATLGIAEADAWGRRFFYRVTNEFTRAKDDTTAIGSCIATPTNKCTLEITDSGNLSVETRDAVTKAKRPLASQVPAVVVSLGSNGYGAINLQNVAQPAPPAINLDEAQNVNVATLVFLSRTPTEIQAGCSDTAAGVPYCEFDDIVTWIPTSILISRMIAAGRLP